MKYVHDTVSPVSWSNIQVGDYFTFEISDDYPCLKLGPLAYFETELGDESMVDSRPSGSVYKVDATLNWRVV